MKTIHLNRHAKSSWTSNAQSDHDRPLNGRGKRNAKFMAKKFASEDEVDLIISSTATRALKTAKEFASALNINKKEMLVTSDIYACGISDFMDVINEVDNKHEKIIIFAHNPGLSDLSSYLDQSNNIDLVTCARVKIVFEVDSWSEISIDSGQIVEHDYPRKYPDSGC